MSSASVAQRARRPANVTQTAPPARDSQAPRRPQQWDGPNQVWAMNWVHDELFDGRRLWVLTVVDLWAYANGITLDFSRPGKPTDNAYVESFNATVRLECLGRHCFLDLPPQWSSNKAIANRSQGGHWFSRLATCAWLRLMGRTAVHESGQDRGHWRLLYHVTCT
jgi:hypothetical protein